MIMHVSLEQVLLMATCMHTVYVPGLAYACVTVWPVPVVESPKYQLTDMGTVATVDVLLNTKTLGCALGLFVAVKDACRLHGVGVVPTTIVLQVSAAQPLVVAMCMQTVYVPACV